MQSSTVIVASQRRELVAALSEAGINVLGPVTTASLALILASHGPADLALIDDQLAGRRTGAELADALYETWGVRSVMLDDLSGEGRPGALAARWAASDDEAEPLRRALELGGVLTGTV
jgi:DNA-binding NarL/FixJ family response regulator